VGKGSIDFIPEMAELASAYLPRNVHEVSRTPYGGAIRLEIEGDEIEDGKGYQLVVTDEPMRRCIELKKNPNQDA
jgi:hypothetical protein